MIESRKIGVITAVVTAFAAVIVILMAVFANSPSADRFTAKSEPAYAQKIFGADIISVNIIADENDWQNMLDNAMSEQYISADIIINNKKISNIGIRPKGNNSLQQVASSDSDRYSFKIKFDEYVSGQTCYGLDMLVLNDMLGDPTYMKEYTAFEMMREMGIETPCFGYAKITLNGEDRGLYLALEAYNESYKQRVSGDTSGDLYNVKSADGKGPAGDGNAPPEMKNFDTETMPTPAGNERDFGGGHERGGFGNFGGIGASNSGGSLVYTDDDLENYSAIFANAVSGKSTESDHKKVLAAIKALNSGEDIEKYWDVDEILRYLAVHTVVVNLDSYSSNMAQNYYIYEHEGVLQILPWDYNYAWGAFQTNSASEVVNFPIDTPVSGVEMAYRPLISKLFENEEYLDRYHKYLKELMDNYFADGKFSAKTAALNSLIGSYVKTDPTAFFTYDEYLTAVSAFNGIAALRAESIYGQLDGTVPSTAEGQKANPSALTDASSVKLSDIGTSGFGGGPDGKDFGGKFDGKMPDFGKDFGGNSGFFSQPEFDGNFAPPDKMRPPDGGFGKGGKQPPDLGKNNEKMPRPEEGKTAPEKENSVQRNTLAETAVCAAALLFAIVGVSLVKRKF